MRRQGTYPNNLADHLIGWTDGTNTTYDLTDAQGSVLTGFSKSMIQGEQATVPTATSVTPTMGALDADKGYIDQDSDTVSMVIVLLERSFCSYELSAYW